MDVLLFLQEYPNRRHIQDVRVRFTAMSYAPFDFTGKCSDKLLYGLAEPMQRNFIHQQAGAVACQFAPAVFPTGT